MPQNLLVVPRHVAIAIAVFCVSITSTSANACGRDTDCLIGNRSYRVAVPEKSDGSRRPGALIFVHGYRGQAARVMKNTALTSLADELGIVFVAAQASGPEWNVPGVPSVDARPGVDELAYFDALLADVVSQFNVDPARVVVSGFSSGAMMVWNLACQRGQTFAGFVPMSGTFWRPIPDGCPTGPVSLIHYHGDKDSVVPLKGRPIKDGHQGDVHKAMALMRSLSDFHSVTGEHSDMLDCEREEDSAKRKLELCMFPGKHELRRRHLVRAWHAIIGAPPR